MCGLGLSQSKSRELLFGNLDATSTPPKELGSNKRSNESMSNRTFVKEKQENNDVMRVATGDTIPLSLPTVAPGATTKTEEEATPKQAQSKYDFVKVRVWLEDHFYVLSRYLVCRALVSTKVCYFILACNS